MLRDAAHRGRGGVGCKHSCNAGDVTLLVGAGVWGGWGGMLTFMYHLWCYAAQRCWGGVGCWTSCNADDVTLLQQRQKLTRDVNDSIPDYVFAFVRRANWGGLPRAETKGSVVFFNECSWSVHVDAKQGWNYELIVMHIPSKIDDGFSNRKQKPSKDFMHTPCWELAETAVTAGPDWGRDVVLV